MYFSRGRGTGDGGRRYAQFAALMLCLVGTSCARKESAPFRVAVLRFENLGGDPSQDWMGRALSETVSVCLAGRPGVYSIPGRTLRGYDALLGPRPVTAPGVSAGRAGALSAGAGRLVYGEYTAAATGLRVHASVEDAASGRIVQTASAAGPDVVAAATALAALLGGGAPPPTRSAAALRSYVEGLEERDPAAAMARLEQAVSTDPGFGPAWRAAMETKARDRDRATFLRLLEDARAHSAAMRPADRAAVNLEWAALRGDAAGHRGALDALMAAEPADPGPPSMLAALAETSHDYPRAAALLRKAFQLSPQDAALANRLGYAEAYAGNLEGAESALRRYGELQPADANPLDSLGDVYLLHGRLPDAERCYLAAYQRDPAFNAGGSLLKAAWSRLMAGDIPGAGATFERYLAGRGGDPLAAYRRAEWQWLTGRRREAVKALDAVTAQSENGPLKELAARARAHQALWQLQLGDAAAARASADAAVSLAGPQSAGLAATARFLCQPAASASEWTLRAERTFSGPGEAPMKMFALACALLFNREFAAAAPLMREIHARWTNSGDPAIPVMLAWAYAGSGRLREAEPLVARNPIPQPGGVNLFTSLWFPRVLFLRAQVLETRGQAEKARAAYRLFLTLSGPVPAIWGEEQRARAAAGR